MPPTNQRTNGLFESSSTLSHGFSQCSALAACPQNPSGSRNDCAYASSYLLLMPPTSSSNHTLEGVGPPRFEGG